MVKKGKKTYFRYGKKEIKNYGAVIFDLDGVLVTTDDCHYKAWKRLAVGISPRKCLVCEDADAGVEAGVRAGMDVLAVGSAKSNAKAK